jgi:N-acyl homoserine lactone hydrolase
MRPRGRGSLGAVTAMSRAEPGSRGPVKAVSVISTGTVRIRPEHPGGSRAPLIWWLLTSRRWTPPQPINVYVIEHARGLILFDTGQDRASVTDGGYFPGGVPGYLQRRLARFDVGEQDTLTAQLATLGYAPADADIAILSHLHVDHVGGLPELTGSKLLVSAAEWAELAKPAPEVRGFLRRHIKLPGLSWQPVTPEPVSDPALAPFTQALDVMGDGSLMLLPTPGHTPGSVSLLVRRAGGPPLLLAGDLTFGAGLLERGQLPGIGSRRQLAESSRKALALAERQPGLVILPAHDPTAAARLLDS